MTERPALEPCFSAACHGMEIGYLLLAHFLTDKRIYVQKRSRIELVMEDLVRQCSLLVELVDGELEEEDSPLTSNAAYVSLSTQVVATGLGLLSPCKSTAVQPSKPQELSLPMSSVTSSASSISLFSLGVNTDEGDEASRNINASNSSGTTSICSPTRRSIGGSGGGEVPLQGTISSSLTQDFPFPCCPPTSTLGARSPALELLLEALAHTVPTLTPSEKNSVTKVIRNITNALEGALRDWSVGLGIEGQLNELRAVVGLPLLASFEARERSGCHLDYSRLVRPEVVAATYKDDYAHAEDFFFRSVHLGTDCWAFIVTRRLESALALASQGEWFKACALVRHASHMLCYLGEHVMMLTSMVLRDYLELKVQIEGTSGEGSLLVKNFRPLTKRLIEPLQSALHHLVLPPSHSSSPEERTEEGSEDEKDGEGVDHVQRALMAVYENPESYSALYAYIKALECVESALLGGFYFNHFRLATNVLGGQGKGTMHKAVAALQVTYERGVFPCLDKSRSLMGQKMDGKLRHLKGKIMSEIIDRQNRE